MTEELIRLLSDQEVRRKLPAACMAGIACNFDTLADGRCALPLPAQLYGMLDHAWSCFASFEESYAEAGDDLKQLVDCMQAPEQHLGGSGLRVVKEQLAKAQQAEKEKKEQLARVQQEAKDLHDEVWNMDSAVQQDVDGPNGVCARFPELRAMMK